MRCASSQRDHDFPHAAGYLAQVAQAAFGTETAAGREWLDTQCHALKHAAHGPATVVAAGRAARAVVAARGAAAALEAVDTSLAYLSKRQAQLAYAAFQAQGYPIGSGIVESANTLVVEARLQGAGMHRARAHVDPIAQGAPGAAHDRLQRSVGRGLARDPAAGARAAPRHGRAAARRAAHPTCGPARPIVAAAGNHRGAGGHRARAPHAASGSGRAERAGHRVTTAGDE
jgi:hypothetical protein